MRVAPGSLTDSVGNARQIFSLLGPAGSCVPMLRDRRYMDPKVEAHRDA